MNKWANIRDSFMRSLRTKSGQGAKKIYMYGEHLQFLLKLAKKDETESNLSQANFECCDGVENSLEVPSPAQSVASNSSLQAQPCELTAKDYTPACNKGNKTKRRELDPIEREIIMELKKTKSSTHQNDHELLLLSFLPYIRDMSETELMDLQMEILTTIKQIKQKRISKLPNYQNPKHPQQSPSPAGSNSSGNNTNLYETSQQNFAYQPPSPAGSSTSVYQDSQHVFVRQSPATNTKSFQSSQETVTYQLPSRQMSYPPQTQDPSRAQVENSEIGQNIFAYRNVFDQCPDEND